MAFVEDKLFRYPAEEECLVRRLGSAVITAWPHLPREVQQKIFDEAKIASGSTLSPSFPPSWMRLSAGGIVRAGSLNHHSVMAHHPGPREARPECKLRVGHPVG